MARSGALPSKAASKEPRKDAWKVVPQGSTKVRFSRNPPPVETRNSFSALEEGKTEDKEDGERADVRSLPTGNVVVIGDSQTRYLDRAFCDRDRQCRIRLCLPGAGIGEVCDRLDSCLDDKGIKPIVCLSAGGNDLGKVRSEKLLESFMQALGKVRDRGGVPVVCSILPRRGVGREWLSRAIAMNCRVAAHCKSNGWSFIDNWDRFFGNDVLYARDGVHLSRQGVQVLADSLESRVGALRCSFR